MWMSSMTSGVKRLLWPRMLVLRFGFAATSGRSAGAFDSMAMMCPQSVLEHQLLFGRLQVVVVPELLAGGDLLQVFDAVGRLQPVEIELALQPRDLVGRLLDGNRVHAKARDLAADVNRAVVHRVAEVLAGVAEHDHPAALHHEARERAGAAADENRAAFHVDAGTRADVALADEIAAAQRRAERRPGVLLDHD